jgi:SAM-dependent methyltransferase
MQSNDYVEQLRLFELDAALFSWLAGRKRMLDVGAGTGWQARRMTERGHDVEAVDLPNGQYTAERIWPVRDYDGRVLPFPDRSFDIVFSSNVLEHVEDLSALLTEIRRVLRPGGFAVHVVPSATWRWWTTLTYYPDRLRRAAQLVLGRLSRDAGKISAAPVAHHAAARSWSQQLVPPPHGTTGSAWDELTYFRRTHWLTVLDSENYETVRHVRGGIFYTGSIILGSALPLTTRRYLSRALGSSTHVFVCRCGDPSDVTS